MADSKLTVTIDGKDNLSGELKKLQSNVIRFTGAISAALASLSVIGFPILESARFQKELLEAAKTTDYTREQIEELRGGLSDLSTQINVSAKDLAKIATAGGQLGIGKGNVDALLSFTEEVARAVTALDISAEEATMSLGKLINIFDVPQTQFRNVISALNEVSNTSTATATQLFDVVRRIGNLGGAVNLAGATALSAAMIDLGLTAETAGTTITKIFADMRAKAQEFASFIGGGMTVERWVKLLQGDGLKALDLYLDKLNQLPPAVAAAAKVDMSGGGRIFEALTKLQDQRLRATLLEEQAARRRIQLDQQRSTMTAAQVAAEEKVVDSLTKQAEKANIVARHAASATEAYKAGDSAVKEQQTVLSGLVAQWQVFLNNISKAAMGMGDEFLIPITELLQHMSSVMREADVGSQLAQGARDITDAFRDAASAAEYFFGGMKAWSDGVDWGSALRATAILAFAGALSLVGSALSFVVSRTISAVPILGTLTTALFGTTRAAIAAKEALAAQQAEQGTGRVGGVFQIASKAAADFASRLTTVDQLQQRLVAGEQQLIGLNAELARRQQALAQAGATVGRALRSRAALEAAIADAVVRRDAAEAAGNRRSASRIQSDINRWSTALPAIAAAEQGVSHIRGQITGLNAALDGTNQRLTAMSTGAVGMVQSFREARAAGLGLAASLATVLVSSSAGTQSLGARLVAPLRAAGAAAAQFGTDLRNAFVQGTAGATGMTASLRGTQAAMVVVGNQMRNLGASGLSAAVAGITSLTQSITRAAVASAGLSAQWTLATSAMARGAVLAATAVNLLGKAVSGVIRLVSGAVQIVFFAVLIKEALQFLGYWDRIVEGFERFWEMLGGDSSKLPDWLRSGRSLKSTAKALDDQAKSYELLNKEAGKFNDNVQNTVTLLSDATSAAKQLNFDENGSKSLAQVREGIDAVAVGYAKLLKTQADIKVLDDQRTKTAQDLVRAERALESARGGYGEARAQQRVEEYRAALDRTNDALALRREEEAKLAVEVPKANENITRSVIRSTDAMLRYRNGQKQGVEVLQQWTEAQARLAEAEQALADKRANQPASVRAPGGAGGAAEAKAYTAAIAELDVAVKKARGDVALLDNELAKATPNNLAFQQWADGVRNSLSPEVMRQIGKDARDALYKVLDPKMGQAVPKIEPKDIINAGATVAVFDQLRSMYTDMAAQATASAERAKNAMSNALEDTRRAAREAEKSIQDFNKAMADNQLKAQNWKIDQRTDADLRKRLNTLDIEYDKERNLVQARYGWNAELLAQEMFALDETFRKRREQEQRIVDLKKAQRDAGQQIEQFNELVASAQKYTKAIEASNKVLQNPAASLEDRAKALKDREEAEIKAKETIQQTEKAAQELAKIPPIGDKFVIPEDKLRAIRDQAAGLGSGVANAIRTALPEVQKTYSEMAGAFAGQARQMTTHIDQAKQALEQYGQQYGKTMPEVIRYIADAAARTEDYAKAMDAVATKVANLKLSPTLIGSGDVTKQAEGIVNSLTQALGKVKDSSIPLTVNQEAFANSISSTLSAIVSSGGIPTTPIDVGVSDASLKQMSSDIEKKVRPEIDVIVNARGNYSDRAGAAGGTSGGFARGGLVGGLKSFANGGKVSGPGTGTSDSILSWLSNGEYVMDALTTSRFGSKFFAMLQAAARGGKASRVLSRIANIGIPGFASGGPVAIPFSGTLPVVEQALSMAGGGDSRPSRDVVDINLTLGGDRVSLFAERSQAAKFVKALKNMESGS